VREPRTEMTVEGRAALDLLLDGNDRYCGERCAADRSAGRRRTLVSGQKPIAAIVGCSDSRVPPDVLFDQPVGSLFVVRTAGHVLSDVGLGSVEYAVDHLSVPLLLVLGHERCGAVTAAIQAEHATGRLAAILEEISASIDVERSGLLDDQVSSTVRRHARRTADALISRSDLIRGRMVRGTLDVVGAIYDLSSGRVAVLPADRSLS